MEQRAYRLLPYLKAKRFTAIKKLGADEFIQRQLNDTRYISKKAAEMLSEICNSVRVLPGQLTAELRRLWGGLNHLLRDPLLTAHDIPVPPNGGANQYAIMDESGKVKALIPMQNPKPESGDGIICVSGLVGKNGDFIEESKWKYLQYKIDETGQPEGKSWARLKVSEPPESLHVFLSKDLHLMKQALALKA